MGLPRRLRTASCSALGFARGGLLSLPGAAASCWDTGTCAGTAAAPIERHATHRAFRACAQREGVPARQRPWTFRSWRCAAPAAAWTWPGRPPPPPPPPPAALRRGWPGAGGARRCARRAPAAVPCAQTWTARSRHLRRAQRSPSQGSREHARARGGGAAAGRACGVCVCARARHTHTRGSRGGPAPGAPTVVGAHGLAVAAALVVKHAQVPLLLGDAPRLGQVPAQHAALPAPRACRAPLPRPLPRSFPSVFGNPPCDKRTGTPN